REYSTNGRRFTTEELMARAASLSPNALLRPVVQDSMLPTVAYVGGPAELADLAQSEVIYRRVVGRMPGALNRRGFTLLHQRSRKLMERYHLSLADFFSGEEVLKERLARSLVPEDLAAKVRRTRAAAQQSLDELVKTLRAFDSTLGRTSDKSRNKIHYQ